MFPPNRITTLVFLQRAANLTQHQTKNRLLVSLLFLVAVAAPISVAAQTTSVIESTVADPQGRLIPGANLTISNPALGSELKLSTDMAGSYRILGLQPGIYQLSVGIPGFATQIYESLTVILNRVITFNIELAVSTIQETITVSANGPQVDTSTSSSGATITRQQIDQMPLNGRNYLDLQQLVPGVAINRQVDVGSDRAVPILGERGGNASFLIDGMPNNNIVDGGSAAPFAQDSILEFQVLTAGYKAEFGHAAGGVVNVVTKSGTSDWHGLFSFFHRNSALDSSDVPGKSVPFLLRWDPSMSLGGPLLKDRFFFFGSLERIREIRQLNFNFPTGIPDFLRAREESFDKHSQLFQTRGVLRLDQQFGRHHLTQQMNLSNSQVTGFLPLSQATSLPSTRTDSGSRHLKVGVQDTFTLGSLGNPFVFHAYVQYRGEPSLLRPTNAEPSPVATLFNMFSSLDTNRLTGDLGQVSFGAGFSSFELKQKYLSTGMQVNKLIGAHDLKFGWDFECTHVNGFEPNNQLNQLFATTSDFAQFGPVNAGVYVLSRVGGPTAANNEIRLRNFYNGVFVQDDWKVANNVNVNVGSRWDYDSRRLSKSFTLDTYYTWANAIDNALHSSFVSEVQTGRGAGALGSLGPTDSFVGVPPTVTDAVSGLTNANSPFIASNGNPVPQAGKFYNGADLDRGPSDLALNHTLLTYGSVALPWQLQITGILRAQSGFHFSASPLRPVDVDGDGLLNGVDFLAGRNHFVAPRSVNVDARFSKRVRINEKVRAEGIFEFFNLFNRANPAAVQQFPNPSSPLGTPLQFLPGREGEVGLRVDF